MAERRMLWKSISRSKKVNLLLKSLEAKILYTWSIPHLDREGLMEADPATLKATVVPLIDEITIANIEGFVQEIAEAGLWEVFHNVKIGTFIRDPVFQERQTIHPHESQSQISKKIKDLKPMSFTSNDNVETSNDNSPLKKEYKRKNIKENSEDLEALKDLALKIMDKYPKFNPYQFIQWAIDDDDDTHPGCLIVDIIPAFEHLLKAEIHNPWGDCVKIVTEEKRKRETIEREKEWAETKDEEKRDVKELVGGIGRKV